MRKRSTRLAAFAAALVATALLQGCAVTTGGFTPIRASASNGSMTSNFDVLRQGNYQRATIGRMQTTHEKGFLDYRYY